MNEFFIHYLILLDPPEMIPCIDSSFTFFVQASVSVWRDIFPRIILGIEWNHSVTPRRWQAYCSGRIWNSLVRLLLALMNDRFFNHYAINRQRSLWYKSSGTDDSFDVDTMYWLRGTGPGFLPGANVRAFVQEKLFVHCPYNTRYYNLTVEAVFLFKTRCFYIL